MMDRKKQKNVSSSVDHYYCKACKVYIADNKSQRLQHEIGAKHKAAAAALVADIAKRNKEAAAKASREQAERDRAEMIANGGRKSVFSRPKVQQEEARSELLARVAAFAAVGTQPQPNVAVEVAVPTTVEEDKVDDDAQGATGYGKWEEVVDVEVPVVEEDANGDGPGLKRKIHAEKTIGAVDDGDEEEIAAQQQGCRVEERAAEGGAIAFKPRASKGKSKRRRKD